MSNILIINAKKQFGHSNGELNQTLSDVAESFLRDLQHEVQVTVVDDGYDIEAEVQKYLWADAVIYQMPGWWMGEPWILKNTSTKCSPPATAACTPAMAAPARRRQEVRLRRPDSGQKYLLSLTWNAPLEAFTDPNQFFHGVGVDGVYLHFHKANQFLGMEALPTFICNDVIKQPDIETDIARYREHLAGIFA